jgi:hypothetical protein
MIRQRTPKLLIFIVASCTVVGANSAAEDWPRFRGPNGCAIADKVALPLHWDVKQNVRWKAAIPGEGFSSPIVWQDKIFLTAASANGQERMVHCIDRGTGKSLWTQSIHHGNPERTSAMTGYAAATAATDGEHVVAAFGNAGIVCYDLAGKLLWRQSLGEFDTELGLASSPIIARHRVILVCDHDGDRFTSFDSFLIAFDVTSGKQLWKTERRGLTRSWSTPIVVPGKDGKEELIISAQDHVRAYDPDTGLQRWQVAATTGWVAPSPVFGGGGDPAGWGRGCDCDTRRVAARNRRRLRVLADPLWRLSLCPHGTRHLDVLRRADGRNSVSAAARWQVHRLAGRGRRQDLLHQRRGNHLRYQSRAAV